MKTRTAGLKFVSSLLASIMLLGSLAIPGQAQRRVIIVNADQPSVWTLEQAHYLLAQMHRRNLDLRAKKLEDLDPNAINGLRFDVLRTLIEAGVSFNEASGFTNRLLKENKEFDATRRPEIMAERDQLRKESLQATREIADLEIEKAKATSDEDKDRLTAQIAAKTSLRSQVDKEIEFKDNELKTLGDGSGEFQSTEPQVQFDKNKLPESVFDEAFKATTKSLIERFNQSPSLNASLMLDNFLQMQYEIVSKQLTLLRDEVGPGERLLFLELPQTINATHHEANKKWAQSWWRIAGYTRRREVPSPAIAPTPSPNASPGVSHAPSPRVSPTASPRQLRENQPPITTVQDYESILRKGEPITMEVATPTPTLDGAEANEMPTPSPITYVSYESQFVNLEDDSPTGALETYLTTKKASFSNRLVRAVELIPRQSSLNVNDMKLKVNAGAFSAVASFLFGFGARVNIQRQREQFSQFVQQELYSSAFGKGSREFGWTFTAMPGTDRLHSGVRTTYAVVVVPEEATSLVLESNGCYFPRSSYQPTNFDETRDTSRWGNSKTSRGCGTNQGFVIPIPNGGTIGSDDFWVRGISYRPVSKDKRLVVLISGANFSSQIGVLVNGVPLTPSIGLAQPQIRDDSSSTSDALDELADEPVRGRIERVDANKIVFSFEVTDFEGTPTITLMSPGKAININWLENVDINGVEPATLSETPSQCGNPAGDCVPRAPWMFGERPRSRNFRIDSIEVFRSRTAGNLRAVVRGAGFQTAAGTSALSRVIVNGNSAISYWVDSPVLLRAEFPVPSDETIQITLVSANADPQKRDTIESEPVTNPALLRVNKVTIVSYEAGTDKKPGVLVVKLKGLGFPPRLNTSDSKRMKVTVTSASEAYLTISNPNEAEVVTLSDPVTGIEINTVVTRKPPPK